MVGWFFLRITLSCVDKKVWQRNKLRGGRFRFLWPRSQAQLAPRFGKLDTSPKNMFFGEKEERRSPDEKTHSVFEQGAVGDDAATGMFS